MSDKDKTLRKLKDSEQKKKNSVKDWDAYLNLLAKLQGVKRRVY